MRKAIYIPANLYLLTTLLLLRVKGKEQRKRAEAVLRKDSWVFSATNEAAHATLPNPSSNSGSSQLSGVCEAGGQTRLSDRRPAQVCLPPKPSILPKLFPSSQSWLSSDISGRDRTVYYCVGQRVCESGTQQSRYFQNCFSASFGRLKLFQVGCKEAKGRLMQSAEQFWAGRETDQVGMKTVVTSFSSFPQMEEWLLARARVGEKYQYTGAREEPRPSSAASVDRRRQRRRAASECKSTLSPFPSSSQSSPQTLKLGRVFHEWGGEVQAQTERAGRGIQRASSRSSNSRGSRGTGGARTAGCPA